MVTLLLLLRMAVVRAEEGIGIGIDGGCTRGAHAHRMEQV